VLVAFVTAEVCILLGQPVIQSGVRSSKELSVVAVSLTWHQKLSLLPFDALVVGFLILAIWLGSLTIRGGSLPVWFGLILFGGYTWFVATQIAGGVPGTFSDNLWKQTGLSFFVVGLLLHVNAVIAGLLNKDVEFPAK
jgi:hypothetical protein